MKRLFTIILSMLLIISGVNIPSVTLKAQSYSPVTLGHSLVNEEVSTNHYEVSNPYLVEAEAVQDSEQTLFGNFIVPMLNATIYDDVDDLVVALRELLVMREGTYELQCYFDDSEDDINSLYSYVISHVFDETNNPKTGDYLYWNFKRASFAVSSYKDSNGDTVFVFASDDCEYLSNASQEAAIDAFIADLLSDSGELGSQDLDNSYEKVQAIYTYAIDNFDYVTGEDNHSTYSALINEKTVCQGYATSLYRLARMMGLKTRVVASTTHGWNIVKIGDYYYHVDATWGDSSGQSDAFFLKGSTDFSSNAAHVVRDRYASPEFKSAYPIAETAYVYDDSTQETTEDSEETSEEDTTSASSESTDDTTTATTTSEETSSEASTTEDTSTTTESTTEATTSTEDTSTTEEGTTETPGEVIYKDDYVAIYEDENGAHSDDEYEQSGDVSTEDWTEEEHVNPEYEIESTDDEVVDPEETDDYIEYPTEEAFVTEEEADKVEGIALVINGKEVETLTYDGEEPIKSLELLGLTNCKITYYNNTGKKIAKNKIESDSPITALMIECDEDIKYAAKTKQQGWLDEINSGFVGSIETDDVIHGFKIALTTDATDDKICTPVIGNCKSVFDYKLSPLSFIMHDEAWGVFIPNGGFFADNKEVNAIRINADIPVTYKVFQGKWLREVSNWVLAGNPFSEEKITGFCLTGDGIRYRILTDSDSWTEWYNSGEEALLEEGYVKDIQIIKR